MCTQARVACRATATVRFASFTFSEGTSTCDSMVCKSAMVRRGESVVSEVQDAYSND